MKWIDWYNNCRLLGPIGYMPPAEAEEAFYANMNTFDMVAYSLKKPPSGKPGAVKADRPRGSCEGGVWELRDVLRGFAGAASSASIRASSAAICAA